MSIVELLFPINCKYNYKKDKKGFCHSTTCMLNQDPRLKEQIKRNGCKAYKRALQETK
jgi:hypothetical protein